MLVITTNNDIVWPFFAVRSEYKERSVCFFADFFEFSSILKGMNIMLTGVHYTVVLSESSLR